MKVLVVLCFIIHFATLDAFYIPYFHNDFSKDFYAGNKKYIRVAFKKTERISAANIALHLMHPSFKEPRLIAQDIPVYAIQEGDPATGILYAWIVPEKLHGEYKLKLSYTQVFAGGNNGKANKVIEEVQTITIHKKPLYNMENENFPTNVRHSSDATMPTIQVKKLSKHQSDGSDDMQMHAAGKLVFLQVNERAAKDLFGAPKKESKGGQKTYHFSSAAFPSSRISLSLAAMALIVGLNILLR